MIVNWFFNLWKFDLFDGNISWKCILPLNISIPNIYQTKNFFIQNIIVNHWTQLVRKYVQEMAYFFSVMMIKLDIYYIIKRIYPVIKKDSSVIFIECTEMNQKTTYANGLWVSISLKNMRSYWGVIGNIHNNECIIYIFTVKVEDGTPIIFNKKLYHCWYKELRNHFSPIFINTIHKNVYF